MDRKPKGHWPLGRRRNVVPAARLAQTLAAVAELLDTRRQRGVVSVRAIAAHVGVADTTVRRWLSGEDHPAPRNLRRIETWIRRQEDARR